MLLLIFILFSILLTLIFYLFVIKTWWVLLLIFLGGIIVSALLFLLSAYIVTLFFPYYKKNKDGTITHREKPYRIYSLYISLACGLVRMFFRIKVINETKNMLPKNESFLLVSNHQSLLDPILIIDTTKRSDVTYLMKQEVRKIPLAGTWLNNSGFYYLNRENNREGLKTIIEAINDIKKGRSVGVFIEGTRSKGPKIGEFHDASLKMALKTKAKIAVVCVDNCYNIMKRYPRKTKVLIKVCKILSYEDYQNMQTIELGNYIKQIMEDTLNEERNSGKY